MRRKAILFQTTNKRNATRENIDTAKKKKHSKKKMNLI